MDDGRGNLGKQAAEREASALPKVPPQQALKALMEDRGLRHKDIAPIVGNKG